MKTFEHIAKRLALILMAYSYPNNALYKVDSVPLVLALIIDLIGIVLIGLLIVVGLANFTDIL